LSGLNTKSVAPQEVQLLPPETQGIDPDNETVSTFENKIATAAMSGEESIETKPEIIDLIMRGRPWSPPGYIVYKSIKVYPIGMTEIIEKRESIQLGQRLLGDKPTNQ